MECLYAALINQNVEGVALLIFLGGRDEMNPHIFLMNSDSRNASDAYVYDI